MAFIEVELLVSKFNSLVQLLASAGPIPMGVVNGLGPDRLIAAWTWNQALVGINPPGYTPPFGILTARCDVTLRHVSISELDADPNAAGATTPAVAWVNVSASAGSLDVSLLAVEVAGAPTQWITPPVLVGRQPAPDFDSVKIAATALLLSGEIVTLRYATLATDPIQTAPLNLLYPTSDDWSIRLSGELFSEQILHTLEASFAKLPKDVSVEDPPNASWDSFYDIWAAFGSVGLKKEDACSGLFGNVSISETVNVTLVPTPDQAVNPTQLIIDLGISSNVSDWDSFRCWAGSFGYATFAVPIIDALGMIISLIAVAETIRLDAGREVAGQDVDGFTPVSIGTTKASYRSKKDIPSLVATTKSGLTNGATRNATTGPFGMLISGSIIFFPADHTVTFSPNGGLLASNYHNSYNCNRMSWARVADVSPILVSDKASTAGMPLGRVPVRIFPSSLVTPPGKWSLQFENPASINQYISVVASPSTGAGDEGRIYLHTSAGIRRFDIEMLLQVADPTPEENIAAITRCMKDSRYFTPQEKMGWLVDPPGYDFGFTPLRQWLFTFAELPAWTRITIHPVLDGVQGEQALVFASENPGEASLELITDAATELLFEHNQDVLPNGRVFQRWLMPTEVIDMSEPAQGLSRSGSLITAVQQNGIFTYDLSTGMNASQESQYQAAKLDTPPFSLTLPGGRVAALMENKLVIGVPLQTSRAVQSLSENEQENTAIA
jgi:hypothetical protein